MFYHKHNNRTNILNGIHIDEPMIFVPWGIDESGFTHMFSNHNISIVVGKNYFVKDVTIFGEQHCNIGVTFDKTMYSLGISRDNCENDNSLKDKSIKTLGDFQAYLKKSFEDFQVALEISFGTPDKRAKIMGDFESCEWDIGERIKIHHYIADRFGLAEYLFIEKG